MKYRIPVKRGQKVLAKAGFYRGRIDGIDGVRTREASTAVLGTLRTTEATLTLAVQKLVGVKMDGLYGPSTDKATETYLGGDDWRDPHIGGTVDGKWPTYSELEKFYGKPGTGHTKILLPYAMKIAWDTEVTITRFTCHRLIEQPLQAIFEETLEHYGRDGIEELGLDQFGGCFNDRAMRGSTKKSTHAYACSIDLDPLRNKLKWRADRARLAKPDALPFWNIVKRHGALSLGQVKGYDWMHFQFSY